MLPLRVLQLKVVREHQVNIHWLASTVQNLINTVCPLVACSRSALTLHPRIHPHTGTGISTCVHSTQTKTAWNTHIHLKIAPCTHLLAHKPICYIVNLAEGLSREAGGQCQRAEAKYVSNSITSAIISTTESEEIGWLPVQQNKSWLVKWTRRTETSSTWRGNSFDILSRKDLKTVMSFSGNSVSNMITWDYMSGQNLWELTLPRMWF